MSRHLSAERLRNGVGGKAHGAPLDFKVLPVPSSGRPESFAGAVGSGFSLEATADRSVVRVGDPIELKIKLTGDATMETLSLPRLDSQMGLSVEDFQVQDEQSFPQFDRIH